MCSFPLPLSGRRVREIKNNEPTPLLRDSFVYIKIDGERKSFSSSRGKKIYIYIYKKLDFYMIAVFFCYLSIMEKGCFSFLLDFRSSYILPILFSSSNSRAYISHEREEFIK